MRRGRSIPSWRACPTALEREQGLVGLDTNQDLLRLRGGVEFYEDRMDVDAAIKALKQVRRLSAWMGPGGVFRVEGNCRFDCSVP